MKPLHAIIFAFLFVVGALYWYSGQQEQHYDAAARRYLQQALTDIGSWQRAALKRQLAEPALQTIDDKQLDALIERYRGLGAFKRVDDLQFSRLTAALSFFNSNILLSYHGTAVFDNGNAPLTATLIVGGGGFQLYNFSFGSPDIISGPANQ